MQSQDNPYQGTILQAAIKRALSFVPQNGRERELARWVVQEMQQPAEPAGLRDYEIPMPELSEAMRGLRGTQPLIDVHVAGQPCLVVINSPRLTDYAREIAVWMCVRNQMQQDAGVIPVPSMGAHPYRCVSIAPEVAAMRFDLDDGGPLTVINTAQALPARVAAMRKLRRAGGRHN